MKIFRTASGALYVVYTVEECDCHSYGNLIMGYRVVRFVHGEFEPTMDQRVDNYFVNSRNHLVLIKDHKVEWESTHLVGSW